MEGAPIKLSGRATLNTLTFIKVAVGNGAR